MTGRSGHEAVIAAAYKEDLAEVNDARQLYEMTVLDRMNHVATVLAEQGPTDDMGPFLLAMYGVGVVTNPSEHSPQRQYERLEALFDERCVTEPFGRRDRGTFMERPTEFFMVSRDDQTTAMARRARGDYPSHRLKVSFLKYAVELSGDTVIGRVFVPARALRLGAESPALRDARYPILTISRSRDEGESEVELGETFPPTLFGNDLASWASGRHPDDYAEAVMQVGEAGRQLKRTMVTT